jgi:hypothetical protein
MKHLLFLLLLQQIKAIYFFFVSGGLARALCYLDVGVDDRDSYEIFFFLRFLSLSYLGDDVISAKKGTRERFKGVVVSFIFAKGNQLGWSD